MLAAPDARAGSYTDTQSGGTTPSTVTPAADTSYAYPRDAIAGGSLPGGNGAPTITVKPGTITDTFTWVPASGQTLTTDLPPACVLVDQDDYAEWHTIDEEGSGTGSGQADCGLPGATVISTVTDIYGPSNSLSATLCSVQPAGASFSVSCTPTASFMGTIGTQGSVIGEAQVSGEASIKRRQYRHDSGLG